jgi:hypothetical protein
MSKSANINSDIPKFTDKKLEAERRYIMYQHLPNIQQYITYMAREIGCSEDTGQVEAPDFNHHVQDMVDVFDRLKAVMKEIHRRARNQKALEKGLNRLPMK